MKHSLLAYRNYFQLFLAICFLIFVMTLPASARGPVSIADIAEGLQSVVVNISTATFQKRQKNKKRAKIPKGSPFEDLFKDFFNENGDGVPQKKISSLGSGFVVRSSGIIVTNNHVIEDADEIFITFSNGEKLKVEKVLGRDKKNDLAVLKVSPKNSLKAAKFGNSKDLRIGDWVMAIGNPFGLGGTVTVGVISAKNRDINSGPYDDFIQTDAAINKGNSGGPLFNMEGEVIGINTAIISPSGGSIGIGFAIPSLSAKNIIDQLIKNGRVQRGWLGVRIQSLSKDIALSLGLKDEKGALISKVMANSPALKSGLKLGDVILKFGGQEVSTMRLLPKIISRSPVDEDIEVEYLRSGEIKTLTLKIEELAETEIELAGGEVTSIPIPKKKTIDPNKTQVLFDMTLSVLTSSLRKKYGIKKEVNGVVVTGVKGGSIAAQKHIKKGNVIVEVAQKLVSTPNDIAQNILQERKTNDRKSVLFLVSDPKGVLRFIALPVTKSAH